jgi:16S rRNA (guanine527-N7)-methyltransferase
MGDDWDERPQTSHGERNQGENGQSQTSQRKTKQEGDIQSGDRQGEIFQGGGKPRPYNTRNADPSLQPFLEGLRQLGLELTEQQLGQFIRYRQELLDWNKRINLTAITDPEEVLLKHFLDSLSVLTVYHKPHARLLDIGTGAGFPGLPLKIVRPRWHVVLLEATGKKVRFLHHLIETLQLKDVVAVHGRAEELAHQAEYRAFFDVVTARAIASLPMLLEYAAPFCRVGGLIILPKKGDLNEELAQGKQAVRQVGAVLKADVAVTLPGLENDRRLLVWEQVRECPRQFPRSGSVMAKKPLGKNIEYSL